MFETCKFEEQREKILSDEKKEMSIDLAVSIQIFDPLKKLDV